MACGKKDSLKHTRLPVKPARTPLDTDIRPFNGPSGYRAVSSSGGAIHVVEGITSANSLFLDVSVYEVVASASSVTN